MLKYLILRTNTHPHVEHIQSVTRSLYIYFGGFMGWVVVGWLEGSWGGWLVGGFMGWVCGGVGGDGVHGGVGGWGVHGWVSLCTHPTQECWVGGHGHDRQVGMMGGWVWGGVVGLNQPILGV